MHCLSKRTMQTSIQSLNYSPTYSSQHSCGSSHGSGTAAMPSVAGSKNFRRAAAATELPRTTKCGPPANMIWHVSSMWSDNEYVSRRTSQSEQWSTRVHRWAEKNLPGILISAGAQWQPSQLLPNPSSPAFFDQVDSCSMHASSLLEQLRLCLGIL